MKAFQRNNGIIKATSSTSKRLMISVPLTGLVRAEWMLARYGQTIPCNWSQVEIIHWMDQYSPLGFQVADARNVAVQKCVEEGYEWLIFLDHDTIPAPDMFIKFNERIIKADIPIYGGVYFTKSVPSEPLIYRGRGTGYVSGWKFGDKVWVDGMGLGCHIIHGGLLQTVWKESQEYVVGGTTVRKVFDTPQKTSFDAEKMMWATTGGTEDLTFYSRLMNDRIFEKSGWKKYQKMKWPLMCDTSLFCKHIDQSGVQYPAAGEEKEFEKK